MLKETPQSLRLYFGLIAALSFFFGIPALARAAGSLQALLLSTENLVFGALFAYIYFKFTVLLPQRPRFIKNVLTANFALSVLGFCLSLTRGLQPGPVLHLLIAALIYYYLVKSVSRLSAEASPPTA